MSKLLCEASIIRELLLWVQVWKSWGAQGISSLWRWAAWQEWSPQCIWKPTCLLRGGTLSYIDKNTGSRIRVTWIKSSPDTALLFKFGKTVQPPHFSLACVHAQLCLTRYDSTSEVVLFFQGIMHTQDWTWIDRCIIYHWATWVSLISTYMAL